MDSEAIDTISVILDYRFERHVIEQFYEAHNQDLSRTVDALINLTLEELEGLEDIHSSVNRLSEKFNQLEVEPQNCALLPELEKHTEILNNLVFMFGETMSTAKIQELAVEVISGDNTLSDEELNNRISALILAHNSAAESVPEEESEPFNFDDIVDTEAFKFEEVSLKRDYNLFVAMFSGVIKDNRLKKLWKKSTESCFGKLGTSSKNLSESDQSDIMDVAVVDAMEFMDTAERKARDANINGDLELAASLAAEDGYVFDPSSYSSSSSSSSSDPSSDLNDYYEDMDAEQEFYGALSTQQAALQFFKTSFSDELAADGNKILDVEIEQALEAFGYDFDRCLQHLREGAPSTSTASSSAAAVSSSASNKSNKTQPAAPMVSYKSASAKFSPSATLTTATVNGRVQTLPHVGPARKMVYRSFRERHGYVNMNAQLAEHFLGILKKLNPHISVRLAGEDQREIQFLGVEGLDSLLTANPSKGVKNVDKFNASHVAIDLHNLGMDVAVQVVDSTISFFLKYIRAYNDRSNFKGYKLVIKFIVGKGLHSLNGIPKIGPATLSYLANERKELVSCLVEGMIYVTCI